MPQQSVLQEQIETTAQVLGDWSGELDAGVMKLTLVLHVAQDATGRLCATFDCLEQGNMNMPVDTTSLLGDSLTLEMKDIKANFVGSLNHERSEIAGKFTQGGISFSLIFKRGIISKPPLKRPQEPKAPYPYEEEEVTYENTAAGLSIAGTLSLPRTEGPFPVALLIAGSGPQNRNEEVAGHKIFFVLADHLTKKGIAVLRVDKRGIGKSTGNYETATSEDFASDVLAGIEYLKTRKEININQIGLIGHSEGGLIAPMVAAKSKDVAFIVLMAGLGVNGKEILLRQAALIQRADGVPEEQIMLDCKFREQTFAIVEKEVDIGIAEKQLREAIAKHLAELSLIQTQAPWVNSYMAMLEQSAEAAIKQMNTPWFRYFLTFEPVTVLKQVKTSILVLNGELDLQVPLQQNLPVIAKALKEAGNNDYTIMELPQLNHLFQTCQTGSIMEYSKIEETISPSVLDIISKWILDRTSK